MDILRGLAHPLIAAPFIIDGFDAAINPDHHALRVQQACSRFQRLGLPQPTFEQARGASRVSGSATMAVALYFIVGKHKRTAAAILAANTVTLAAINCPSNVNGEQSRKERKEARKTSRKKALEYGTMLGGLLLATVDRQGEPSWKWARSFNKQRRSALEAAREQAFQEGQQAGEKAAAHTLRVSAKHA